MLNIVNHFYKECVLDRNLFSYNGVYIKCEHL